MARKKKMLTTSWYSPDRILSFKCRYNLIFGERKNGKTFSVFIKTREEIEKMEDFCFVYMRRRHRMVVSSKMKDLWAEHSGWCVEHLGSKIDYDGSGAFYIMEEGVPKTVGYKTCVEDAFIDKGLTFGMHKKVFIIFDEFIDNSYMEDELKLFQQCIANIVRNENTQEVTIFMLGNTVSKHCPYFDFFGLDIQEIKQGQIATLRDPNGGTVAVEYCASKVENLSKAKTSEYFGWNHPTSKMILHGEWEYDDHNTEPIDGVKWSSKRHLIKAYVTGLKNVYEMSIHMDRNPVAFVRTVNTQYGIVNRRIKYNLSFDNSLNLLYHGEEPVPKYRKLSKFMDDDVLEDVEILCECIKCGRVIYSSIEVGTEFNLALDNIRK